MDDSRAGLIIMTLPLLIFILVFLVALYDAGFDLEAATLPENPAGPMEETITALVEAEQPLVTGSSVESDPASGTVSLGGTVENPTAYPLQVTRLEYRYLGVGGSFAALLAETVVVSPGERAAVVLTGPASQDVVYRMRSGSGEGMLIAEFELMGIRITTETTRSWKEGA